MQEALRNALKHSGAQHIEVGLWGTPHEVHLSVSERGIGFDSEAAKRGRGLGLVSMEERLKLHKGMLSIESQPKQGITIQRSTLECLSVREVVSCGPRLQVQGEDFAA